MLPFSLIGGPTSIGVDSWIRCEPIGILAIEVLGYKISIDSPAIGILVPP